MEKITEQLLLEKGLPKTNKLEEIKSLNLSKLGLKLKDLPVVLLSRLSSLERWDLSGNRLQELPKTLKLPTLRYLDLSDNQMEDVMTLESLGAVEELKMEDNLYITVSDNYKLMVLLPNLRIYNGKDVSSTAIHLRYVYSKNLKTRIIAVWEKGFRLPDPIEAEKLLDLETNFVNTACQQVKYGPSSVSDFTKWKVGIMAKDYLHFLVQQVKEAKRSKEISTPTKRKMVEMAPGTNLTPRNKLRSELSDSTAVDSPSKSSTHLKTSVGNIAVRVSPCKMGKPVSTHGRGQRMVETSKRTTRKERGAHSQQDPSLSITQRDTDVASTPKTQQPLSLKPLHVLQCHSKEDHSEDFSTQLWACAFHPKPDVSGGAAESRLVATCGGDSLCVIDCETGIVMKKYKVPGEEFFSLAWSTVLMSRESRQAQHCNILAAGGKRGLVKLIHPRNNVAYGEFRASRKSLSVLHFNHRQGNFLFAGSYDNKITMWDIGGVDSEYNYKVVQLLQLETSSTPLHLCLPPSSPSTHLLAACEDGLHCFNTQGANCTTKRSKEMEITFPISKKEDKDHDARTVDGLSFLSDDIVASKNYKQDAIYLWSWIRTKAQKPDKKSRTVCAVVLAELQWTNTEIPYLALTTCPGQAYVVCGDDRGKLWTYDIAPLHNNFKTGRAILPTKVLEWPRVLRKGLGQIEGPSINNVAMDYQLHYLVALSDKNMVVVWKRED